MRWSVSWTQLREALLDLLFPPRCVGCGRWGERLCAACLAGVERIRPPVCSRCGRPVRAAASLCAVCRTYPLTVDGIRSVAYFEGPLREAVHAFKYRGVRTLAQPLAELLVAYQRVYRLPAGMVVPVPLHPQREAERGYNQAALLAHAVGEALALPVAVDVLARVRATPPQVGLNAAERRVNVRAAFVATAAVSGRSVLLIDDVCTTGATLDACAVALKAQGAASVWGLTVARGR